MKYIVFTTRDYDPVPTYICISIETVQSAIQELITDYEQDESDIEVYELGRKGAISRSINITFGDKT